MGEHFGAKGEIKVRSFMHNNAYNADETQNYAGLNNFVRVNFLNMEFKVAL